MNTFTKFGGNPGLRLTARLTKISMMSMMVMAMLVVVVAVIYQAEVGPG